jgi:hypothetical protein
MGRRKTVRELQRDLTYATAKEAYVKPARAEGGTPRRLPKTPVKYNSYLAQKSYIVQASATSLAEFGGLAALGLEQADDSGLAPRGFKPAMIHASYGDTTPSYVRARGSGRSYIRYGKGARDSNTQYTFAAPITDAGTAATATPADVRARFELVSDAKKPVAGAYGRIWMEWERLPIVESGTAL